MLKQLRYVLFHCVFLYLLGESCMQMWDLMQAGKWHPRTAMVPSDESCGSKNWLHLCITYALMSGRVEQPKVIAGHVCYLWISRSLEPLVISLRHMFSWCKHIIPYHSISFIITHHISIIVPYLHHYKNMTFHLHFLHFHIFTRLRSGSLEASHWLDEENFPRWPFSRRPHREPVVDVLRLMAIATPIVTIFTGMATGPRANGKLKIIENVIM